MRPRGSPLPPLHATGLCALLVAGCAAEKAPLREAPRPPAAVTTRPAPRAAPPAPEGDVSERVLTSAKGELGLPGILAFQPGTDQFAPGLSHDATLQALVRYLAAHPEVTRIRIEGHTDSMGLASRNERISGQRAARVKAWLVAHGVADRRVVAVGCGETKPIATNRTAEGRAQNRRMILLVVEKQGKPFLGRDAHGGCAPY